MKFVEKCSKEVGKFEADNFDMDHFAICERKGIESPIEQILFCALLLVCQFNYLKKPYQEEIHGKNYIFGLGIYPQQEIENYRVDFEVCNYGCLLNSDGSQQKPVSVIIECDGHNFHERTEKERRYEKKRDRYLQSRGYKIFHYTGSEICKNALNIAAEIISFITNFDINDIQIDSNIGN